MKKSLIALAVAAGTIAAAQAADTTTLYGSIGFSSTLSKSEEVKDAVKGIKDNKWDIATSTNKIGVKGTEDLDNGLQTFFQVEANLSGKKLGYAFLGFKGDFGTLTIGQQKTLFKQVTDTGLFEDVGVIKGGQYFDEDTNKLESLDYPGTVAKVVSYVSPEASGLKFGASVLADGDDDASKGADAWEAAAMYSQNGLNAGLAYAKKKIDSTDSIEFTGLNVGFAQDQYEVVGRVLHTSSLATDYSVEGQYVSGKNTFRAGVGFLDPKDTNDYVDNVYTYALGYKYNFSDRTYTWVEGQYDDHKAKEVKDGFQALVGVRHDF